MQAHSFRILLALIALAIIGTATTADESQVDTQKQKYVIIHADDAGMSRSVNRATIDSMEQGIVSSASIMVPCPWFPEFAKYAKAHPEMDFGLHLTLNSEWSYYRWGPVASRNQVPSLVDKDNYLWDGVVDVAVRAKAKEVETELRAQIERAKAFGINVTHLDTHMGSAFARPDIAAVYIKLGHEYKLPVLLVKPTQSNQLAERYPQLKPLLASLENLGMPILDELYQFYSDGPYDERKELYLKTLRELKPGVSQIIIHCGYQGPELEAITSSVNIRDTDRRVFMDPEVIAEVKALDVKIITWREFAAMSK